MKNSVNDDSPDTELREYKQQIWQMTVDIENCAEELCEQIKDNRYKNNRSFCRNIIIITTLLFYCDYPQ